MKKIGRILSLVVCFQLAWGCQSNDPVTASSSGPAEGYTELSGSVTLAFMKVTEMLVPSAVATVDSMRNKLKKTSQNSAEHMANNLPLDCNVSEIKSAEEEIKKDSTRTAHLIDYSDLNNPCRIKEIKLQVSSDGETASYKLQIENELVEDKIVALVYGDDKNGVYKNAVFAIEKGTRVVKQHLNDESTVKAEVLSVQIQNEISGVEMTDEVKLQIKDRIKELKKIEDFGFDLLGDKEVMIAILNNPAVKDEMIKALIEARNAKEIEGEVDSSTISDAYTSLISAGTKAASEGGLKLKDFLRMQCSPDHVFVAKNGEKDYVLQFASVSSILLEQMSLRFGREVKNEKFSFEPSSEVHRFNDDIGKIFWNARDIIKEAKSKISFKLIISDPDEKESDRSCNITIAPPSFDFAALERFSFKGYETFDDAIRALEILQKHLFGAFSNKLLLDDSEISPVEEKLVESEKEKADAIVLSLRDKISNYFKSYYASNGLGMDRSKIAGLKYKEYKTPSEALQALSDVYLIAYASFKDNLYKKLEAKALTQEGFNRVFKFEVKLSDLQRSVVDHDITTYFHGIYVLKDLAIDFKDIDSFNFNDYETRDEAMKALDELKAIVDEDYKQVMKKKFEAANISREEFDNIISFELEVANDKFWEVSNDLNEYFNDLQK
jgi:hypothetical protein